MHLRFDKGINTCILISDGIPEEVFFEALIEKYELTDTELEEFKQHTKFEYQPRLLIADTILVVNGTLRMLGATIIANKKLLFRCSDMEPGLDVPGWTVLEDYDVYEHRIPNSVHYKKKILFNRYKKRTPAHPNVGMFYAKSNSKRTTPEEISSLVTKYKDKFDKFILLTDIPMEVPPEVEIRIIPILDLWDSFGTYIYTHAENVHVVDCSPRFVAECAFYGKEMLIEAPKIDRGLATRLRDIEHGDVWLRPTDEISTKI